MPQAIEVNLQTDDIAKDISLKFQSWDAAKQGWLKEYKETLEYLYATDTKAIMTQKHDYNNITHIPKLTQIADVLETYYLESIFSLNEPIVFEDFRTNYSDVNKKRAIRKFANTVLLEQSNLKEVVRACIKDYIVAGNAFAMPVWEEDYVEVNGTKHIRYSGIKFERIAPSDIVFDVTAPSFAKSPKIIRSVVSLSDLAKVVESNPEYKKGFEKMLANRKTYREVLASGEEIREDALSIAGLGSLTDYYTSDMVELLIFYGDYFDINTNKLYKAKKITVADRNVLLHSSDLPNVNFFENIFQTRWRDRVDNLWGMSPLSNLLGMQYRIDFLENKRADIYDWLSDPMFKTKGEVLMPEVAGPGTEFNCPIDGDVSFMHPNPDILTADTYITRYMDLMDIMAGSPSEVSGFRTPGEKTMFEVSQLQTAASRMFTRQIRKFEEELLEKVLNCALQLYAYNQRGQEIILEDYASNGSPEKIKISVEELLRPGVLKATGSINYADKALMVQTLQQLGNSNIFMDEAVRANFSPSKIGAIIAYATGLDNIEGLYRKNARLFEVTDQKLLTERLMRQLDEQKAQALIEQEQKARMMTSLAEGEAELEEDFEDEEDGE